jgi:hypothetical protein
LFKESCELRALRWRTSRFGATLLQNPIMDVEDTLMARRGLISAALFALGSIGCGDYTLDPLPLEVTITATPTSSTINQDIVFEVRAQGGQLLGD